MKDSAAALLLLALACFVAGILAIPFALQGGVEVPRHFRVLIVVIAFSLATFLGLLGFKASDDEVPSPILWLLLLVPLALLLHHCT